MKIYIKNMVCPRCIMAVKNIILSLGLTPLSVILGEAEIKEDVDEQQKENISKALMQMGFELLDNPKAQLVEQLRV